MMTKRVLLVLLVLPGPGFWLRVMRDDGSLLTNFSGGTDRILRGVSHNSHR
jgi:hypothetical protein